MFRPTKVCSSCGVSRSMTNLAKWDAYYFCKPCYSTKVFDLEAGFNSMLTGNQTRKFLRVSPHTLTKLIKSGKLKPSRGATNRLFFRVQDVIAFRNRNNVGGNDSNDDKNI